MSFAPLVGPFGQWLKRYRETKLDLTQAAFADEVLCSVATIQSYEQGRVFPSKEAAQRIAVFIGYPNIDEFILFARQGRSYGRRARPRAKSYYPEIGPLAEPTIVAENWPIVIEERFKNNNNRWGLGFKDDGIGLIHRMMIDGAYILTLIPKSPLGCFLGGDSAITAPETFYLTVEVERIEGPADSTGGIAFEELHDNHHALFHLRNEEQEFAVADVRQGGVELRRVIPWQPRADVIRVRGTNTFGLLARGDHFTFFINNVEVGVGCIARTPGTRLDVAIGGITINQRIVYMYRNLLLRTPPI